MSARRTGRWRAAARLWLCVAALPLLMGSKCEQPLVMDSGFDVWCGAALCDWQVDAGSITKVATWHERDYGVGLVGSDVQISQLLHAGSGDVSCLHFDLLASVDDAVDVQVAVDFDDDGGAPEFRETVPSGQWTPLSYHVTAPSYFHDLRITIRKQGDGQAALAHIQAAKSSDCAAPAPLGMLGRPAGATCEVASQCGAGACLPRAGAEELTPAPAPARSACETCADSASCAAGTVCGLDWSDAFLEPFRACVPPVGAGLGERCLTAAECTSGACCAGACSTCCADGTGPTCAGGDSCRERPRDAQKLPLRAAWQCAPGEGRGGAGVPCLADADCASGSCAGGGVLRLCVDGRTCASDADCPGGAPNNSCIALGVAGGRCQ